MIWAAVIPDAPPSQTGDAASLVLQSYPVAKSAATPAEPDTTQTPDAEPQAARTRPQSVPNQRATSVAVDATRLTTASVPSKTAQPADVSLPTIESRTAAGDSVTSLPPQVELVTPAAPESATASPVKPPPDRVVAEALPSRVIAAQIAATEAAISSAIPRPSAAVLRPPAAVAQAAPLPQDALADQAIPATALRPTRANTIALPATAIPSPTQALATVQATSEPQPALVAVAQPAQSLTPIAAPTPQPAVASNPLPPVQTTSQPAPGIDPAPQPVAQTPPDAPRLAASAPQGTPTTATLALPGAENMRDPLSLTALQSFLAPQEGATEDPLRDGVAALLAAIPCARVQARYDPAAQALVLAGHVPNPAGQAPLVAALQAQMGVDIPVRADLRVLPEPQCSALTGVSQIGLPQSNDQITNPLLVGPDTHAREFAYVAGDQLVLEIESPDYPAYVYVDYFDSGGHVIHLAPNEVTPLVQSQPASPLRIGARSQEDPGLLITIGPPYGQEIAVAFASSTPLFNETRPLVEPAGPYLEDLRARIAEARATTPDFKGEWAYFFVTTRSE